MSHDIAAAEQLADLRRRITGIVELLGHDELAALEIVAAGLVRGREIYGPLHVDTDQRDMRAEALEELRDSMVYSAAGMLRLMRGA